uniref:myeloid cell surface antigen CD33-like n=1 Tax=Jaculus jaculus TaxID=51337 RepID=UPI001E1B066B|nr:myeloid cell surface antigen CD33-like [Jaculus jaculus]
MATECKDVGQRYKLEVQELVTVQEGLCVLVPCELRHPYSFKSFGSWFRTEADPYHDSPVATNNQMKLVQKDTKGRFYILQDPLKNNCSLDIRDAQKGDNGSYFFLPEGYKTWNYCKNLSVVHVTALTHTPHINLPMTLDAGHPSNLTCSVPWACERGTPPIFSWMSSALISTGPRTTLSSMLTLMPRPQDHGTYLTCQVTFPGAGVTVERTIQLNVTCESGTKAATEELLGVIGGIGVTALLAICFCLIFFIVKSHRKKAARTMVDMNYRSPASQGQQKDSNFHRPAEHPSSSRESPALGMEQDLHYATLNFHGART